VAEQDQPSARLLSWHSVCQSSQLLEGHQQVETTPGRRAP
jgi:hypothetical protein